MAVQIPFTKTIESVTAASIVEDTFLASLLQQFEVNDKEPEWLRKIRQQATNWVSRLQVPTRKDEDWRFIDLSDLIATEFIIPSQPVMSYHGTTLLETENSRLEFVNGILSRSSLSGLPAGIYVGNLVDIGNNYPVDSYFAQQHGAQDIFTALNTAGCQDIAVIWVDKNVVVETPIHLVFASQGNDQATFTQPRVLVVAESGANISLIEEYIGEREYFTNAVTEIVIKENAAVQHTRLQQESTASFHIGKTAVNQARDSRYTINEINFGGRLSRHNPEILQQGEQTETNLNGLTIATEKQTADTHSTIALTKAHGKTDQLHKCIASGRAHTVFNGKVFVPKAAQMTDASQLNRNLLLSSKARVDTKPELQITADNVKCSHGATVSQLAAEEIFYLRSRGLSGNDARQLLIDAFAAEICDRISLKSLRSKIATTVIEKTNNS